MVRRIADISLCLVTGLLLLPICLLAAIAIVIDDNGRIIYRSPRIGLKGKPFNMLKFRTLNTLNHSMSQEQLEEFNRNFKLKNEIRTTRVGYWLRRFSIDEIPQLVNVLKGDMSIIGPRPKLPEEIHLYGKDKDELLSVLPGMTGYWQVHRKSAASDETMREMDLYYIRKRSIFMDVKIFLLTIPAIALKRNY